MVKTLYEVEQAIAQYQEHIRKLEQIIQEGTSAGKQAAIAKLGKVREDLDLLLKQRTRVAKDKGLSSYNLGQNSDVQKSIPIWGFIGMLALFGVIFSSGS